jgi:multidrug efflux pump subunit AcrA (membrane-fusion protein)
MLATAEIELAGAELLVSIPSHAVQQINDEDVVFVQKSPGRFEVRPVRLGETVNSRVSVLEGLSAGEVIATRGSFILKSLALKSSLESE